MPTTSSPPSPPPQGAASGQTPVAHLGRRPTRASARPTRRNGSTTVYLSKTAGRRQPHPARQLRPSRLPRRRRQLHPHGPGGAAERHQRPVLSSASSPPAPRRPTSIRPIPGVVDQGSYRRALRVHLHRQRHRRVRRHDHRRRPRRRISWSARVTIPAAARRGHGDRRVLHRAKPGRRRRCQRQLDRQHPAASGGRSQSGHRRRHATPIRAR